MYLYSYSISIDFPGSGRGRHRAEAALAGHRRLRGAPGVAPRAPAGQRGAITIIMFYY